MSDNPLKEYTSLLIDLHQLTGEGKNDSPEADAIRDKMDVPYQKLSGSEIQLMNEFSNKLYKLYEDASLEKIMNVFSNRVRLFLKISSDRKSILCRYCHNELYRKGNEHLKVEWHEGACPVKALMLMEREPHKVG